MQQQGRGRWQRKQQSRSQQPLQQRAPLQSKQQPEWSQLALSLQRRLCLTCSCVRVCSGWERSRQLRGRIVRGHTSGRASPICCQSRRPGVQGVVAKRCRSEQMHCDGQRNPEATMSSRGRCCRRCSAGSCLSARCRSGPWLPVQTPQWQAASREDSALEIETHTTAHTFECDTPQRCTGLCSDPNRRQRRCHRETNLDDSCAPGRHDHRDKNAPTLLSDRCVCSHLLYAAYLLS